MNFLNDRAMTELLSGRGAGLIGIGLGARFSHQLKKIVLPLILFGVFAHGIGMYATKQLDKTSVELSSLTWGLYYSCWILLIGLIAFFMFKRKRHNFHL